MPEGSVAAGPGKTLAAERDIAYVRLTVILFNIGAYWMFLRPQGIPWLALVVSVVAPAYAFFVVLTRPYLRWPILSAALFTAATDSVLITVWILATGGFSSPFHLLWFLSLLAVSFRYDARATLVATLLYVACYVGLLAALGQLQGNSVEVLVRMVYLCLAGALGVLMARETTRAFATRDALAREMEEQRRQQQANEMARLREVDRFKTDFLNAAAHELGTPLTPLHLQVHLLQQAEVDGNAEARKRATTVIGRNVERLAALVQDMLDVARLQSGRLAIQRQPADLATLVRDAAETFRPSANAKGVKLDVDGAASLVVAVDPKRTSQVVYNLVSNAIKYTPPGGRVAVRYEADDRIARLEVQDTGLGFDAEQRSRMFTPFGQVHGGQTQAPGTGLGLFISRGIAERHGGHLEASSAGPGQGATFVCVLAQRPDASSPAADAEPTAAVP